MNALYVKHEQSINELAAACARVASLGYVTSQGGNLSARVEDDVVLITPTQTPKGQVTPADICIVTMSGEVLHAPPGKRPTGELPFHLRIFAKRPDARGIVHAHPPILTGFALLDSKLLERPYLPEPVLELGPIVMVPYAEPLSEELAQSFDAAIDRSNAFLMQNHGALMVTTEGVMRALEFMEMAEAQAMSLAVAKLFGGARELPLEDVRNLERTRVTRSMPLPGKPGAVKGYDELFFG